MRKFISMLAIAITVMSLTANSVFAAEINAEGTGSSDAVLTTESATFSVTVPMQLPINVDKDGIVTTATDAKIVNNSHGAVKVTNAEITGANGWSVIGFDSKVENLKVGAKEFGFELNGGATVGSVLTFNAAGFPVLAGANDTDSDELLLTYDAVVAPQASALTSEKIADVVFTVDWNE